MGHVIGGRSGTPMTNRAQASLSVGKKSQGLVASRTSSNTRRCADRIYLHIPKPAIDLLLGLVLVRGKVQQQWGKLTDDDLTTIEGRRVELVGTIQERYGIACFQLPSIRSSS
jgi:CsbD-like